MYSRVTTGCQTYFFIPIVLFVCFVFVCFVFCFLFFLFFHPYCLTTALPSPVDQSFAHSKTVTHPPRVIVTPGGTICSLETRFSKAIELRVTGTHFPSWSIEMMVSRVGSPCFCSLFTHSCFLCT